MNNAQGYFGTAGISVDLCNLWSWLNNILEKESTKNTFILSLQILNEIWIFLKLVICIIYIFSNIIQLYI